MSMTFIGPSGTCEFPWIQYALLRDNIFHYLERTQPAGAFPELRRAGEALGGRTVATSALRLRDEAARAQALCTLAVEKLAISSVTKGILLMHADPQSSPELPTEVVGLKIELPWLGGEAKSLGDVFGNLIAGLLDITRGAKDTDQVEVIDS